MPGIHKTDPAPSSGGCVLHSTSALEDWDKYTSLISNTNSSTVPDGKALDIGSILAVARNRTPVSVTEDAREKLWASVNALKHSLERGETIYGVNTGFGGSADTRNDRVEELQQALLRELHCGVVISPSSSSKQTATSTSKLSCSSIAAALDSTLACEGAETSTCMPQSWARATILIRINSLISGYSAVRPVIIDRMTDLLRLDIIPRIPLRGSISASGDLSPLSYIGGAIQGKPSIQVFSGLTDAYQSRSAREALAQSGLEPVSVGPKETLAIVNGTAASCGVAVLAVHDANQLALLSQVLTAMSVEGLRGTSESFNPVFAELRPHPGQIDAATNIRGFLHGSKLIQDSETEAGALRQDRYSIRTASQWLGPVLEDLQLARQQLMTESNSVTDNPLIDAQGNSLHGGNFQARAVTSAMEKVRQGIQTMGRMLFAQLTELVNPVMNRGLPPNLVVDDPSTSFVLKPLDIQSAALLSELGFLANPAGTHVQTAEMGNQALNSLALISARYTHTAIEVLSMLAAGHILAACQALDIRAMNAQFFRTLEPLVKHTVDERLRHVLACRAQGEQSPAQAAEYAKATVWNQFLKCFDSTTTMDREERFREISKDLRSSLLNKDLVILSRVSALADLNAWVQSVEGVIRDCYNAVRDDYVLHGRASCLLGPASQKLYDYVRDELDIPLLHTDVLKDDNHHEPVTIGSYVAKIYQALRKGLLYQPVMDSVREVQTSPYSQGPEPLNVRLKSDY